MWWFAVLLSRRRSGPFPTLQGGTVTPSVTPRRNPRTRSPRDHWWAIQDSNLEPMDKNEKQPSASVGNGEITRDEHCPIATDQTGDAVSKPLGAFSRSTLIAPLYEHASALAQAGDIEAARVAHEAAGKLLRVPDPAAAVVDLNERRKP